jgi:PncC family amidohydrolase
MTNPRIQPENSTDSPQTPQPPTSLAREVADLLALTKTRIVFAESCTAGLVSATLARVPGISEFHCGSAVVYRLDTKTRWLGVAASLLQDPGPVSDEVVRAMAVGVLERTPEANVSAAITGHLGPNAPADQDGLVFIGIARRVPSGIDVRTIRRVLPAEVTGMSEAGTQSLREWRQGKAVELVLSFVRDELSPPPG